jgi:hypothetical protein
MYGFQEDLEIPDGRSLLNKAIRVEHLLGAVRNEDRMFGDNGIYLFSYVCRYNNKAYRPKTTWGTRVNT